MRFALVVVSLAAASAAILADLRNRWGLVYVFRPAAMASIVAAAAIAAPAQAAPYRELVLAGLAACFAGDVFMMLRKKRFLHGLAAFLAAQVLFAAAFAAHPARTPRTCTFVVLAAYGGTFAGALWSRLGKRKIPVAAYVAALVVMAWLAVERWAASPGPRLLFGAAGALLFVVSDSSLAVNAFVRRRRFGQALTLGSYYAALGLIALSI